MTKSALRTVLRQNRSDFAETRRFITPEDAANPPARLAAWLSSARCVAAYWPIHGEVDPIPLLAHLASLGIVTALPHVVSAGEPMRFLEWRPGDALHQGVYGLSQPDRDAAERVPDLILTPLLGFDRRLYRLGYGAGFYDASFAANPSAVRVGLAWSIQEIPAVPTDDWDIPLHGLWTEREWIEPE